MTSINGGDLVNGKKSGAMTSHGMRIKSSYRGSKDTNVNNHHNKSSNVFNNNFSSSGTDSLFVVQGETTDLGT